MENKHQDNIYYTYNPFKKEFLKNKGVYYIAEGTHRNTGKNYWAYLRNTQLDQALKNWRIHQEKRFQNN